MLEGGLADPDDAALVARIVAGSADALAEAYDRHAAVVFGAAVRLTGDRQVAEDVVQETFLALWNRAETYDADRGSLRTWLSTIARNRSVDRLRAIRRRPKAISLGGDGDGSADSGDALERLIAGSDDARAAASADPAAAYDATELRATLARVVAEMPEPERQVIVLAYGEGLTQAEIADRLAWPLGTVKTRTRRALHRLRASLAEVAPELAPHPEVVDGEP
jgi:RNA polymerase sigma-70 factor (ECF subfamily)